MNNNILAVDGGKSITLDDITDKSRNKHYCYRCSKEIPQDRIEALVFLEKQERLFDCFDCAQDTKKVKGFYENLSGVSKLNIVHDLEPEEHLVPDEEKEEINESCLIGEEFYNE